MQNIGQWVVNRKFASGNLSSASYEKTLGDMIIFLS